MTPKALPTQQQRRARLLGMLDNAGMIRADLAAIVGMHPEALKRLLRMSDVRELESDQTVFLAMAVLTRFHPDKLEPVERQAAEDAIRQLMVSPVMSREMLALLRRIRDLPVRRTTAHISQTRLSALEAEGLIAIQEGEPVLTPAGLALIDAPQE